MQAALVKLDVAAATLGWSAVKLLSLADEGTLLDPGFTWVWNLANNLDGERRDLRWWVPEIEDRRSKMEDSKAGSEYELAEVIDLILPTKRNTFHAGEVDQMFQIRHRTRLDYGIELNGGLVNGRTLYPRDTLVAFLQRRWIHQPLSPRDWRLTARYQPIKPKGNPRGEPPPNCMTLPKETLLNLGAIMATAQVAEHLSDGWDAFQSRGVQAGVVAALLAILTPEQFREVVTGWEIDQIRLAELLEIAGITDKTTTIEA